MTDDMISRQAAIDALDKRFDSIPMEQTAEILLLRRDLRDLPSAQPTGTKTVQVDDCISRAAVVALVEEVESKRLKGEIDLTYAPMIKGINALSSTQPGWIPCSVMLPENDGVYLVTLRAITQLQKACAKIDIARFDGKWHKAYPVVAWMPLPKPYREGGQS